MKWKRNNLLKRIIKKSHPFLSWLGGWGHVSILSPCVPQIERLKIMDAERAP